MEYVMCLWIVCGLYVLFLKKIVFLKFFLEKVLKKYVNFLNVFYFRVKEKQRKKQKRREVLERGDIMVFIRKKL